MKIKTIPVGFLQENCYLVYDEGKTAAVIDPGDEGERILSAIDTHGLKVTCILLTHGHYDHTGAIMQIQNHCGAALCIAKEDVEMLVDPVISLATKHRWNVKDIKVDRMLCDGDRVEVGTMAFDVIATPGHSKGSVTYRCDDTLFTGDTLFAGECGRTDLHGGSYPAIKASLKRLSELEGDYRVLPGHGPATTLSQERLHNPYIGTQDYDTYF